jgi:predicted nucleotidyltransferase
MHNQDEGTMVDPKIVADRYRRENARELEALDARRALAQELGRRLARRIIDAFPESRRVWGFGSTYQTWRKYRKTSDIDLAVEEGDAMELMRLVEDEEFAVDLLDLSSCQPSMANHVRDHGVVLAESVHE